ncbi:MAG: glycerophosphodiester phosphodiesterase [Muribaculum sp.]|nr:glycerophosphodiester phosphodiesterase [Muribaculum sp.]
MRKIISITMLMALFIVCHLQAATPKVIAHRGYWKTEGSAQNSIRALIKADSIGSYGSEFDVWLTVDNVPVVNHDAIINGYRIENTDAATILAQRLANGETVPTLDAYLSAAQPLKCRLICELKTHDSRAKERKAVKDILEMMKKYGLEDRVEYITFSKDAFKDFIKSAPAGTDVYYLDGDYVPAQIAEMGGKGLDYSIGAMRRHPQWFEQAHQLGLLVNVWTVDKEEDMKWCIGNGADFITTNQPELLQKLLQETPTQSVNDETSSK